MSTHFLFSTPTLLSLGPRPSPSPGPCVFPCLSPHLSSILLLPVCHPLVEQIASCGLILCMFYPMFFCPVVCLIFPPPPLPLPLLAPGLLGVQPSLYLCPCLHLVCQVWSPPSHLTLSLVIFTLSRILFFKLKSAFTQTPPDDSLLLQSPNPSVFSVHLCYLRLISLPVTSNLLWPASGSPVSNIWFILCCYAGGYYYIGFV